MKTLVPSAVLAILALSALAYAGCAHKDFNTGFKEMLVTQAQEDLSCADVEARKVKGPDKPGTTRMAVWHVEGCGKKQPYTAYCMGDFYASCSFAMGDSTSFGQ